MFDRNHFLILCAVFLFVSCSANVADETDTYSYDEPDSGLLRSFTKTEEPDSAIEEPDSGTEESDSRTEEPDSGTEEPDSGTEEPDSGTEKPDSAIEKPDSGTEKPDSAIEKPDSGTEEPDSGTEETDSAIEEPDSGTEKPDSSVSECTLLGIWSITIYSQTIACISGGPFPVGITDCDQLDIEQSVEIDVPSFGLFSGTIVFHIELESDDSLKGTADIAGILSTPYLTSECFSEGKISGIR